MLLRSGGALWWSNSYSGPLSEVIFYPGCFGSDCVTVAAISGDWAVQHFLLHCLVLFDQDRRDPEPVGILRERTKLVSGRENLPAH